jgi:hypothetical protein
MHIEYPVHGDLERGESDQFDNMIPDILRKTKNSLLGERLT